MEEINVQHLPFELTKEFLEEIRQLKQAFRLLYLQNLPIQEAIAQLAQLTDNRHVQHLQKFIEFSLADNRRGLIGGK